MVGLAIIRASRRNLPSAMKTMTSPSWDTCGAVHPRTGPEEPGKVQFMLDWDGMG